jgi:uncharacterized protein YgiM (DUF1202 family)
MMKKILALTLAVVIALACTAVFAEEVAEDNTYWVYTDNGKELNIRNAPGGDIIGKLNVGEKVTVLAFLNENWAVINYKENELGYVNTRFLIKIDPEELKKAIEEEQEEITGDPMTDIDAEFASAVDVEDYKITARPARVTSVVSMRWIPSETGRAIAHYKATEELVVLKELDHYLQVQDPDTGDVGYIHKKFAAK